MRTYLPKLVTKPAKTLTVFGYMYLNGKPKLTKEGKAMLSTVKGREKHSLKNTILGK